MSEYGALIEKAREWDGGETTAVFGVLDSLADAVEALVAENEKLNRMLDEAIPITSAEALIAERDALRAQLDNMTTEWETVSGDDPPIRTHNWKSGEMEHLRSYAETSGSKILKRLVGPWVEVTDER